MKPTKSILILLSLFLISNCGENLIEEVKERYGGGELKVVEYYKKIGDTQKLVRKREYYENGQIKGEENYKNGNRYLINFWNKDGELLVKDGNGKWTSYYENGEIKEEQNYKDGKKDGKWIWYHLNGQIIGEGNHKDGERVGKWIFYYENGKIWEEGNYKDGKEDGKWIEYYKNGQIEKETNYKNGELVK